MRESPEHGSGAIVRESPEHGSGAELRTTAVTEPKHARAPTSEQWIKNITYLIVVKNTRVSEFSVFGSTDMHEEKNIEERGKLNCSGRCCSSLHIFQLSFGCIGLVLIKIGERLVKTRDDCSEVFTVEKLDDQSVTNHSGNGQQTLRARGVALSRTQFPGMTELDVVDEDDTVDDFDELGAGAAVPGITIVCDVLSQGSFLFVTGWYNPCAF